MTPKLFLAFFYSLAVLAGEKVADDPIIFFEKKIRPVLAERCFECHSHQAKKLKGALYLDSLEGMLKGGETGVAIVQGEPDKSRVIEAIRYGNPDLQMPPKTKLTDEAVADLTYWVKIGAPWPKEEAVAVVDQEAERRKKEHWAWQPVRVPEVPHPKSKEGLRSEIDQFIFAKLEEKGLTPATPADRRTLIRRAYFDLIGLPPTIEETEAFVADASPEAFAKVVDHLLASPHYGERYARHWLDVARYGEDQAHSFQPRLYPQGFRYRDWLIQAFNSDLPYDRFITEQIAGDLIDSPGRQERLPALGYFAVGPVYYGDGKMFDQIDDRVDTLTRGFMGVTVACARCHDHKFDPISTKDYYALAGIFFSSEYVEAPLAPEAEVKKYDDAQKAIAEKTKQLDKMIEDETARMIESGKKDIPRYIIAAWKIKSTGKSASTIAKEDGLEKPALDRWVKYLSEKGQHPALSGWDELAAGKDFAQEKNLEKISSFAEGFQKYFLSLEKLRKAIDEAHNAKLAVTSTEQKEKLVKPVLDRADMTFLDDVSGKDGVLNLPKNQIEKMLSARTNSSYATVKNDLENDKKNAPPKYAFAHSLKEGSKIADIPVLIRGNVANPGEIAPRGFPAILNHGQTRAFTNGSGRLELARAIASPDNPLTARVMVNRIWQHHFGQGLVRTPSNFGLLGERPSHPELLDYLADQFVRKGWSIKALHRDIMLSTTYQMSSRFDRADNEIDPDNKYVWRMNRRRLEVEPWRDSLLAVAGDLNPSVGGPSAELGSVDNQRRTLYGIVSRHELNPLLRLFDFPDPNVTSDARTSTTVPLQQLFVLNSEFMVKHAKSLAARLTKSEASSDADRIQKAFLAVYGRLPSATEVHLGEEFIEKSQGENERLSKWEQYAQVLLSANEFLYVD